jgi:hypothetical protein
MLSELTIEYLDGRKEVKIVNAKETTLYPQRDGIKHAGCKAFKYEVPKHNILPKMIVRLGDKTYIYPSQTECHPETTLQDVIEILSEQQMEQVKSSLPKKEEPKKWKFESVSGGGIYVVTQTPKGLKCDCMGYFRARDRRCKHIKEVENY